MPAVCFYFQVHQPFRLKEQPLAMSHHYFDDEKNKQILRKVANKCYLPTNQALLELIEKHEGRFRCSFSISGVALEQMEKWGQDVLESFQKLARTGCVEFIAETYYHSLSAIFSEKEFRKQVANQVKLVKKYFGQTPTAFRNTELIYQDFVGQLASKMGFEAVIAEGPDDILQWRSPNFVYQVPETSTKLLLKNYKLSDDIAFRFSNRGWADWPLTTEKYVNWLRPNWKAHTINLFMDYETFGEHQWAETGIFDFLRALPGKVLEMEGWSFKTPTEVARENEPVADMHFPRLTSWADAERDLTAWRGNQMQERALKEVYELAQMMEDVEDEDTIHVWRKLQTSDHFYYMCTKWFADGDVHAYFSPYANPYEAFIHYMEALDHFKRKRLPAIMAAPSAMTHDQAQAEMRFEVQVRARSHTEHAVEEAMQAAKFAKPRTRKLSSGKKARKPHEGATKAAAAAAAKKTKKKASKKKTTAKRQTRAAKYRAAKAMTAKAKAALAAKLAAQKEQDEHGPDAANP